MDEVVEALEKYQGLVPLVYDVETMGLAEARPQDMQYAVYLKREADKVIASRDYEIKSLKDSIGKLLKAKTEQIIAEVMQKALIYGEGFVRVEDMMTLIIELRRQKYKRCLAMARLCHERSLWWYSKGYGFKKYDKFWEKWEKRWLELADKFKEAK